MFHVIQCTVLFIFFSLSYLFDFIIGYCSTFGYFSNSSLSLYCIEEQLNVTFNIYLLDDRVVGHRTVPIKLLVPFQIHFALKHAMKIPSRKMCFLVKQ